MSVCDSASVDIESDETIAAGEKVTISETDFSPCYPQANCTALDAFPIESGYVTKGSEATIYLWTMKLTFLGNRGMDKDSEVRTRP